MSETIHAAAEATDAIQQQAGEAIDLLRDAFEGRIVNGCGVYSDPVLQRRNLKAAIAALTKAERTLAATTWPADEDYDEG